MLLVQGEESLGHIVGINWKALYIYIYGAWGGVVVKSLRY